MGVGGVCVWVGGWGGGGVGLYPDGVSPLPWFPRAQLIPYRDGVCGSAGGLQPYSQVACVRCALGVRLELRWGLAGIDADLDAGPLILQPLQPLEVVSRYVSVGEQGGGRSSVCSFETITRAYVDYVKGG